MIHSFSLRHSGSFLVLASLLACESNEADLLQGGSTTTPAPAEQVGSPPAAPLAVDPESEQRAGSAVHDSPAAAGTDGLPPEHPPLEGVAGSALGLAWVAPSHWQSQPPSSNMRLAQWSLPGEPPAECAVFNFAGGGDAQDNVQRWIRQFEPTAGVAADEAEQAQITANGLTITLVRAGGTYLAQGPTMTGPVERRPDHRLFGAITTIGEQMYFMKCIGAGVTMLAQETGIVTLVQSLRPAVTPEP